MLLLGAATLSKRAVDHREAMRMSWVCVKCGRKSTTFSWGTVVAGGKLERFQVITITLPL